MCWKHYFFSTPSTSGRRLMCWRNMSTMIYDLQHLNRYQLANWRLEFFWKWDAMALNGQWMKNLFQNFSESNRKWKISDTCVYNGVRQNYAIKLNQIKKNSMTSKWYYDLLSISWMAQNKARTTFIWHFDIEIDRYRFWFWLWFYGAHSKKHKRP